MRAHLELQRALEQEVHETSRIEEFRSNADRDIGDHIETLKKKGVQQDILKEIENSDDKLRELLDKRLHDVLQHFNTVSHKARGNLQRVARAIVSDVELEKKRNRSVQEKNGKHGLSRRK